jgi:hypothetical protein
MPYFSIALAAGVYTWPYMLWPILPNKLALSFAYDTSIFLGKLDIHM